MLDEQLLERILERLSLAARPTTDITGLRAVYAAWCLSVPFDNIAKLIALRTGSPGSLPGLDPVEFFHRWLDHGAAGTCWPTSNALFELLSSLGFDARRVAGSMRDTGIVSHGSVKLNTDDGEWLVDSSMLTGVPLPLTLDLHVSAHELHAAEVEHTEGTHIIWADLPPSPTLVPCRLLVDPATIGFYAERYEASRLRSPFNQRLYARRDTAREIVVLSANLRVSKTSGTVKSEELDRSRLCEALRDEIGISGTLVEEWRRSGALDASFDPPSGPPVPPITAKPPSQRTV